MSMVPGESITYGLALMTGLLMGAHCVGMCGGFVVAYVTRGAAGGKAPYTSHGLYAMGKLISYGSIGALFGLLGSAISVTPLARGIIMISAGVFLVAYGLNTLRVLPMPRITLRAPAFATRIAGRHRGPGGHPLVLGLLSGFFIACGPLHAMYVMAAGTGSPFEGGLLLLLFGAGTLPSLVGFGTLTSFVSGRMTARILRYSGAVVVLLGMLMINRGVALASSKDGNASCCHRPEAPVDPVDATVGSDTTAAEQ